eukprot:3755327-Rhodomonas_salina.2
MELVRLGKEQFRCVEARWNAGVQSRMAKSSGGGQCVRIEEGMAILAQSMRMDEAIHPSPEPFRNIPDCTEDGQCQVCCCGCVGVPLCHCIGLGVSVRCNT